VEDPRVVWRDGELIPFADATCHVLSHVAARGSQVFDVLLVTATDRGPCAVGLRPHVTRFLRSADLMGMEQVGEVGELERAVAETVMANLDGAGPAGRRGPFVVKLIAAWVEEVVGVVPASLRPTVFVTSVPAEGDGIPAVPDTPARVRSSAMPKIPAEILPPSLKVAASYTPGLREQLRSLSEGFDHTVFRSVSGDLAESTTLSVLVVSGGRVLAPPLDAVLDGITRRTVLDAAQDHGIPVEVRAVPWSEVVAADELILSSTTHPVIPVGRLDDRDLSAPGPVTAGLADTMAAIYRGRHRLSDRWLTPLTA
jgi:branched-chain amino acid aminotransferase